jgi:hypothetical protein
MIFKSEIPFSDFSTYPEPCLPAEGLPVGICEVVDVASADELPYVFEITAGQRLAFSMTASHEIDLVLCDEDAYDEWIDGGLQSEHPPKTILTLRHGCQHSLEFKSMRDTTLVVILINLGDSQVYAVVAASVLDASGSPC